MSLVGFYARFLENLKEIERPLQDMVRADDMQWTKARKKAFRDLKELVTSDKCLAQPDWEKDFFLETDSSKYAVGGVLYQMDGEDRKAPIMWVGRKLTNSELNYCTREQELLAILYCIERCRMFLYGRRFTVRSDCMNLCWLYENDLSGRVARWAMKLNAYDFTIEHIRGKKNVVADCISRRPYHEGTPAAEEKGPASEIHMIDAVGDTDFAEDRDRRVRWDGKAWVKGQVSRGQV